MRCYKRAESLQDTDLAVSKLATLHEKSNQPDEAVYYYKRYLVRLIHVHD